ncbi:RagB/SusD family nutrient uptake outer membrane protein [Sphingobacterium rhinopitheci]|uniref:RagB/SusD family nutrient uptake outer membrane protein n=1 Tax=Sphingobacterium rhinopitheci TaxID=2781960 RepID=UPI001F526096|nr:RagB/SusD family nutrient uptake outer membrane protein [Sphingobacterium rhinopitheci]MCI0920322.1 RagB/SusD family nutrient uptake outer membrane protein [Sphingobacterium rhinopitheci]
MKRNLYSCALILGLLSASCSKDYLNRYPTDSPSSDTFLTNEDQLDMAVIGAYNTLYSNPSVAPLPFAFAIDYASDIAWERNTNDLQKLGGGLADVNNTFTSNYWSLLYAGISRCNAILDKANQLALVVPAEKLDTRISEVRFLRAYYYFYLNELFGGVPLITRTLNLSEANVPKSTKEEVNDFILNELDDITTKLPITISAENTGRISRGAALALASRAALFNKKWAKSVSAAKALMDLNHYELNPNFGELFTYSGENSKEIILATQYNKALDKIQGIPSQYLSRYLGGFSNKIPVQSLIDSYECTDGLSIDKSTLYNVNKPFENRDPRLAQTIVLPQSLLWGTVFETHPDSLRTWDYSSGSAVRVNNTDATNAYSTFSGFLWRKYTDELDRPDRTKSELNTILIRYAEVLLNYVEAKVELGEIDDSVYDAINEIRQRPNVNMPIITKGKSIDQMRSIVRKERKYELSGEGLRWFDIRRWGIAHEVMNGPLLGRIRNGWLSNPPEIDANGTPDYTNVRNKAEMRIIENRIFNKDRDYVWPIPRLETEVNTSLEQNNNY